MPVPVRPARQDPPQHVVHSDRRWFLVMSAGFLASFAGLFVLHAVYRATGPHSGVTRFLRSVKTTFSRVVPRFRRL
jgi:hypothetical protein